MAESRPQCWCHRYAIGTCTECHQPVCELHGTGRRADGMLIHRQHEEERTQAAQAAQARLREQQAQQAAHAEQLNHQAITTILPQFLRGMDRIGNPGTIVLERERGHGGQFRHLNDSLFAPAPRAWIISQERVTRGGGSESGEYDVIETTVLQALPNGRFHLLFSWDPGNPPRRPTKRRECGIRPHIILRAIIPLIEQYRLPIEIP